jgi:hypothetical protein
MASTRAIADRLAKPKSAKSSLLCAGTQEHLPEELCVEKIDLFMKTGDLRGRLVSNASTTLTRHELIRVIAAAPWGRFATQPAQGLARTAFALKIDRHYRAVIRLGIPIEGDDIRCYRPEPSYAAWAEHLAVKFRSR